MENKMKSQSSDFLEGWLNGLERSGVLAPRAAAELLSIAEHRMPTAKSLSERVEKIVRLLTDGGPDGVRFLSPTSPLPSANEHPFAKASRMLAPALSDLGRNSLANLFAVEIGGLSDTEGGPPSPGRMAGRIVGKILDNREHHDLLDTKLRPETPSWEVRVKGVLDAFKSRGYLNAGVNTAELATDKDWAGLGHGTPQSIARTVANRLGSSYPELLRAGVEPPKVDLTDPFFSEKAAARENGVEDTPQTEEARSFVGSQW